VNSRHLRRCLSKMASIIIIVIIIGAAAAAVGYYFSQPSPTSPTGTTPTTSPTTQPPTETTTPPQKKVVIYAALSEMTTADPSTDFSNSIMWMAVVYEPLLWYKPLKNEFIPALAESYEHNEE